MEDYYKKLSLSELNRDQADTYKNKEKIPVIIVLDNIRSMSNIGSVFRTSDAFLIQEIHLCGITSCPPHKEIHKTALGATETVKWKYYKNTMDSIQELTKEQFTIVSVEQTKNSTPLNEFHPKKGHRYVLVFGNEVKGVEQEVINASDFSLEIPQFGTKHSLNISISVGIVIWDLFKKITW